VSITVKVGASEAKIKVSMPLVDRVEMGEPAEMKALKKDDPAAVMVTVKPLIERFRGLPAAWLVDSMGVLADAYLAQGKTAEAKDQYEEIEKLYPGSRFLIKAAVGKVKVAFQSGDANGAAALLAPLLLEANKTVAPTTSDGQIYGEAS
jgi:hypothetical protein